MGVKKLSLKEKISAKLVKVGIHQRKAKSLAEELSPSVGRMKVKIEEKIATKLVKLGIPERQAKKLAKDLAPTVRAAIKAKDADRSRTVEQHEDDAIEEVMIRFDLPVAPVQGGKGLELLSVVNGLTSGATYLVAAVKGDNGFVAVKKFSDNSFKLKFYPNMKYWDKTLEELSSLGGEQYLHRDMYERMMFDAKGMQNVLDRISAEAKPKSRVKTLIGRMQALNGDKVRAAFVKFWQDRNIV